MRRGEKEGGRRGKKRKDMRLVTDCNHKVYCASADVRHINVRNDLRISSPGVEYTQQQAIVNRTAEHSSY